MAAHDPPHVCFENQRNGPATASQPYPGRVPGKESSGMDMGIAFSSELEALRSPFTLKSSLPAGVAPVPLSLTLCTRQATPLQDTTGLDLIDMPSTVVPFASHSGLTPDITSAPVAHTHEDLMRISSLERQVCSDYVCCGTFLIDFHALINHFEEKHVSVVAPNGKRIYPPERLKQQRRPGSVSGDISPPSTLQSGGTTPTSSRSSSVVSSVPATPISAMNILLDYIAPTTHTAAEYNSYTGLELSPGSTTSHPYNSDIISAFGPEYDFSKDYACYEHHFAERIEGLRQQERRDANRTEEEAQADMNDIYSMFSSYEEPSKACVSTCPTDDPFDSDAPPVLSRKSVASSSKKRISKIRRDCETPDADGSTSNDGGKVVKPKPKTTAIHIGSNIVPTIGRRREKTYKCPRHGCSKSYLNPNGLKYHLEKGTCKFDDLEIDNVELASNEPPPPDSPASPSSLVGTPPSTTNSCASNSFAYQYSTTPITSLKLTVKPTQLSLDSHKTFTPQEVFQSVLMQPATVAASVASVEEQRNQSLTTGAQCSTSPSPVPSATTVIHSRPTQILAPTARLPALGYPYILGRGQACDGAPSSSL